MAAFLTSADLEARAGASTVLRLCDDDGDGVIGAADATRLDEILQEAEGLVYARLLRAFGSAASIDLLMAADPASKGQAAWIALELLSERRVEFAAQDGWGAYKAQYERAMAHFDALSKAQLRSPGESAAGGNAQVGGNYQPRPPADTEAQFTFAPSRRSPYGRGGF